MKLSLPLEYKKLPEFFDAHNINDDSEQKNIVLEKLLKKYQAKTILDIIPFPTKKVSLRNCKLSFIFLAKNLQKASVVWIYNFVF